MAAIVIQVNFPFVRFGDRKKKGLEWKDNALLTLINVDDNVGILCPQNVLQ